MLEVLTAKRAYLLIGSTLLVLVGFWQLVKAEPLADGQVRQVTVDQAKLQVTVAGTDASRSRGLAGSPQLDDRHGMLFFFPQPAVQQFWMKGVGFPIDIIWINQQTVTEVTPNVPAPAANTPDEALPTYSPSGPADRVVEVRAGWAAANNIQPGDPLKL